MTRSRYKAGGLTAAILVVALMSGCAATEDNPLNVNTARDGQRSEGTASAGQDADGRSLAGQSEPDSAFVGDNLGDDPLNVGADGAKLCGVQPKGGVLTYTVMLHNPTLQTFVFGDIGLGSPNGLTAVSAEITPANREGHGNHGAAPGAHGEHEAVPTPEPTAPSTFAVEPVPATGYVFEPDQHINIVVAVELNEGVQRGTAENVLVGFSTPEREYSVPHNLNITIDAATCA
ncbi:hypothetical protein [Arthrobacter sp. Br18]|uniref:hypothetical protein n=1 Tax=Arthrobacter sp. Br18 TaxID=1312954 RepID=UPI0012DEB9B1|nr:hypothetical protein [Arthrobacter sp. Br18]